MEMVLLMGLQAAGKSEFYKRQFYNTHLRINLDMLKTRRREQIFIDACLRTKQPFVVDNTNPTVESRQQYIALAKAAGFAVKGYYFQCDIKDALSRNALRPKGEMVPPQAIYATQRKLVPPSYTEGFDQLCCVTISGGGFTVEDF